MASPTSRATQFSPEKWLRIPNRFEEFSVLWKRVGCVPIPVGLVSWGLCGGIASAALDLFHKQQLPPNRPFTPNNDSILFKWIKQRQVDSITPRDLSKYLTLLFTDLEKDQLEILQTWKEIKADVAKGFPVVIGLETRKVEAWYKVHQIAQIIHNHQVVVWKFEENGDEVTLYLYDSKMPETINITLSFNLKSPNSIKCTPSTLGPVYAFFKTSYKPKDPNLMTNIDPGGNT